MPRGLLGPDTFTATGPGQARQSPDLGTILTLTAAVVGTGTVSATVQIEGSNDGTYWFSVGAPLSIGAGASPQSATAVRSPFSYAQYRANCTAISGTNAALTTAIGVGA